MRYWRIVLGLVIGIAVALLVISVIEWLDGRLFPMPAIDWHDPAAVSGLIAAMPLAAQAMVVAGWFLGALAGAAVAALIARRGWAGWVPAAAVLLGGIANALMIAHPWWMNAGAVLAPLAGGWLGIRLAARRVMSAGQ